MNPTRGGVTANASSATTKRAGRSLAATSSLTAFALVAIAMLVVSPRAVPGAFVWNFTPSVPLGLYRIEATSWVRGDRVAVRPSAHLAEILATAGVLEPDRLLLKRVAAWGGDTVCRNGEDVSVNGIVVAHAKSVDSRGLKLPDWTGCEQLDAHKVLLLGEMSESFDGRYFGSTDAADIVGRISPVILLPTQAP